jgi:hypothetical protein
VGFYLGDHILKLHLGFEDHAYAARYEPSSPLTATVKGKAPKRPTRGQQVYGEGKTTQEVAKDLETRYGLVEIFWSRVEDEFTEMLEDAFSDAIEQVMTVSEMSVRDTGRAAVSGALGLSKETEKIERRFRQALSGKEFDGLPGVPTLAAQRGVSHLRRHPYAKRGPRPSFIDTGMYQRSFRAWIEEDD